jgi:nucleotide-binding universal stress UspA family protein
MMYSTIAVPVDLAHVERLGKALRTAVDLAGHYGATLHYVGATTETPGPLGRTPAEYRCKLEDFAAAESERTGIPAKAKTIVSLDLTIDLDKQLLAAFDEVGADLVVMASHVPGIKEHFFGSNAGWLAAHSPMSVLVVR